MYAQQVPVENDHIIAKTKAWLSSMVIGLNLCPFADAVFKGDRIRYAVFRGTHPREFLKALEDELQRLAVADRRVCETTLLIAPEILPDFLDFNDFVGIAENSVVDLGFSGVIQVVGFHPEFQFADSTRHAPENYTNRSPYPMIHLLREISVSEVAGDKSDLMEIPRRNTKVLQALGLAKILERLKG